MSRSFKILLLFLSLNFLLFLPRFVIELGDSTFFPWKAFLETGFYDKVKYLFFNRANFDMFRLASDYLALVILSYVFARYIRFRFWRYLIPSIYIIMFLYQFYFSLFEGLYHTPPLLYNDLHSIRTAWQILQDSLGFWFFLVLILFGLLLTLLWWSNYRLAARMKDWKPALWIKILAAMLVVLALTSFYRFRFHSEASQVIQIPLAGLAHNISESRQAAAILDNFDRQELMEANPYESYRLERKPNFFFIFIESYGRVVLDHAEITPLYKETTRQLTDTLEKNHWYAASHLSRSPVTGGISWISYSSFLYGFNFLNQGTYLALMEDSSMNRYPHFTRYLNQQGYKNFRLSSIAANEKMTIPWADYSRFYAVDQWILFNEMNYTGTVYGFGPAPPDQFALNYAYDLIRSDTCAHFSLFFITQNSHSPFYAPDHPVAGWAGLNDGSLDPGQRSRFMDPPTVESYRSAIRYELEFLVDFIIKSGTPDDLFILIGDHQPPFLTGEDDSFETPVHIISRDSLWVESLKEFGFRAGLMPGSDIQSLKHEGMYSLLMHVLLKHYGFPSQPVPSYHPEGFIQLDR